MMDKHAFRRNPLAAVLAATLGLAGAQAAQAADPLPVRGPLHAAPADAQGAAARIIVRYKDGTAAAGDRNAKLAAATAALGRAGLASATARGAAAPQVGYVRRLGTGADLLRVSGKLTPAQLERVRAEIAADPAVKSASIDRLKQPLLVPNDPYYAAYQWHYSNAAGGVNAQPAWDKAQGEGVVVAILDTGILPGHPDIAVNKLEGYDFITDTFVSRRPTDARVPGALDYGDWNPVAGECYAGSPARDSSWHGSHVSGTVAENTNNAVGMAGLAYKATVLPVRVLGRCGGYTSDIADAIIWASGGHVDGVPDNANPAEVINMSLGGGGSCDDETQAAIDGAVSRGTTVVVAAGNDADDAANYSPASCNNVISVGATRINGGIASYSNYGAKVDLSAPGGGGSVDGNPGGYVWQLGYTGATTPTSGSYSYYGMAGTSMASPHVAATVALVQGALAAAGSAPLTPAAVEALLKQTARPFPVAPPANKPIGSGIVDANAAVEKALTPPCDPGSGDCAPDATPLTNKVVIGGQSGGDQLFSFQASAGQVLSVLTYGGSGDVSLYVSLGKEPTTTSFDAKSTRTGNSETVRITAPKAGIYYIRLLGNPSYTNVSVVARQ
ncbi:S8 family serine peptidase [Stenotrophomonas sp. HITSZ_GD]|uniref:S8 family peptidase n=1 Tax=Stenotrophomonas sp. HITSZ_GD TaxID=3037248 RepID=UPI00240E1FB4|nr:S8 family peptidase [Stenotrophomonas sp. HITSZ_GD]MDG2525676.1 S8 family serine peptidase [Stenotrophomonas sp. HITSZ_GD]